MLTKDTEVKDVATNQDQKGNINKLLPSQLLFSDQNKAMDNSKPTRAPVVIDKEAFERTLHSFNNQKKVTSLILNAFTWYFSRIPLLLIRDVCQKYR